MRIMLPYDPEVSNDEAIQFPQGKQTSPTEYLQTMDKREEDKITKGRTIFVSPLVLSATT